MPVTVRRAATALLGLLLATAGARAGEEVSFKASARRAGEVCKISESFRMDMGLSVKVAGQLMQQTSQKETSVTVREVEVLETGEGGAGKVKITYRQRHSLRPSPDGGDNRKVSPMQGRSYLVEGGAGRLKVTYADGSAAPAEEAVQVAADCPAPGGREPIADLLDGRTLKPGESLQVPAALGARLLKLSGGRGKVEKFTYTLTGTREAGGRTCAVFETVLVVVSRQNPGTSSRMEQKGTSLFTLDCRPAGTELTGKVTLTGGNPEKKVVIEGTGTSEAKTEFEYR